MLSVDGITSNKLTGNFKRTATWKAPNAEAAPPISPFIASIPERGFRQYPPVSNVKPLPTKAVIFSKRGVP